MGAVGVPPGEGGLGLDDPVIILPGRKERSVLWERLRRRDEARMPPLATSEVDALAVEVIGAWIDSLPE
jgi:hypothetical protein